MIEKRVADIRNLRQQRERQVREPINGQHRPPGFQILFSGFYQGIGRGVPSLCFSILRQFLLIIPLVWGLSRLFGLKGAWCAFPITDTTAFALAAAYFWHNGRRLLKP